MSGSKNNYYMILFPNAVIIIMQYKVKCNGDFPHSPNQDSHPTLPATPTEHQLAVHILWRTPIAAIAKTFTKDIILLTKADGDCVPRGSKRSSLYDSGRIANMVDFQSSWSEERVRGHIEHSFKGLIDLNKPYPRYVLFAIA